MLTNLLTQFLKEEEGGLVEYLILIAIAAVAAALLFPPLRTNLVEWFNTMTDNINNAISGTGTTISEPTGTTIDDW